MGRRKACVGTSNSLGHDGNRLASIRRRFVSVRQLGLLRTAVHRTRFLEAMVPVDHQTEGNEAEDTRIGPPRAPADVRGPLPTDVEYSAA
jgi:hypothetical protein